MVPNVLSRVENSVSKTSKKISRAEQSSNRSETKTCGISQELADIFKLRDIILSVTTILLHQGEYMIVFLASVIFVKWHDLQVDGSPSLDLLPIVLGPGNRLAMSIAFSDVGKIIPPLSIGRIPEAWMISVKIRSIHQDVV